MNRQGIRLAADIGGTFTDIVLDVRGELHTTKVLTNYSAPEQAILDGIESVTRAAAISPRAIDTVIHGTTLATNALIERRGARTAFVTTEGFRDVIEIRTENRFDQFDLDLVLPAPLVPREDRFPVVGRVSARGLELHALDEAELERLATVLADSDFESVAIGFIHAYANASHERRAREILARKLSIPISISAEVSPQMRELERFNTVCANAYVRPMMASYLARLRDRLRELDVDCPVFLMHSGGGLMSVEAASEFPIRLVESGPAGGAIFASSIAHRFDLSKVISYDMGGTTAKVCLINDCKPQTARTFEVGRSHRFCKGSGMPVSIPVIEMIEIGAGGGSIASVNSLGQIQIGPESAGSEPGPACYQRGGKRPTVTDADLILGKLDPRRFAGGDIHLSTDEAASAVVADIGASLGLPALESAFGVCEMVDENMANAARVHTVENGRVIDDYTMIAFGGAAPSHAARLCEKLNIERCLVPRGASVGSAIGFLAAPFAYEGLASQVMRVAQFDAGAVNSILSGLRETAESFVRSGTDGDVVFETTVYMRYVGQGWEIPVTLPDREFIDADGDMLMKLFREHYERFFGRAIEGLEAECVTWAVKAYDIRPLPAKVDILTRGESVAEGTRTRRIFDPTADDYIDAADIERDELAVGTRVAGPAVIVERETSTVVTSSFDAIVQGDKSILLVRKAQPL